MTFGRLIARGLAYHRRLHAGLLAGAVLTSAILTGALVVGDSARQSLRDIATARLGHATHAMDWGTRFFKVSLADALKSTMPAHAILRLPGVATGSSGGSDATRRQVNRVDILGVDEGFWNLAERPPREPGLGPQEAFVNEKAAQTLGLKAGDDLSLRIAKPSKLPLDAPLASHAEDPSVTCRVTVRAVLSDRQFGAFGLAASQVTPYNVFLDRAWLQEQVDLPRAANVLIANARGHDLDAALEQVWRLDHIGIRFRDDASGLVQVESNRVFLDDAVVKAASTLPGARPTLTYLVNSIAKGGRATPYSFVIAGALPNDALHDGEVVINQWLADHIQAAPGDAVEVAYYRLQSNNAMAEEKASFRVRTVTGMDSLKIERDLAPEFPGLSNVEDCQDWAVGMPMDEARLKDPDNEAYWKQFRQTPKLLTTFDDGKRLWGNRFGGATAIRFQGIEEARLGEQLRRALTAKDVGLAFQPVRDQALAAVNQAQDLGGLVIGLSFFLIIAALTLLGLLQVFGLQQRASEAGLLLALGFPRTKVRGLFLAEALVTGGVGSCLGGVAGVGYAYALLALLTSLWPEAMAGRSAIHLYMAPGVLASGALLAFLCVALVAFAGVWRNTRRGAASLLTTDLSAPPRITRRGPRLALALAVVCLLAALGTAGYVVTARPANVAEPFLGVGALLLTGMLSLHGMLLGHLANHHSFRAPTRWKLALTNLARRRGRSLGVAGVTASGCFLVFAVVGMQGNVGLNAERRDSGTGGFAYYADSTIPLTGTPEDIDKRFGLSCVPIRVHDGDDAGCLNLNRAQAPRILGVDAAAFVKRGAFAPKIWDLLNAPLENGEIPALAGDTDTALWGLQAKTGPRDGAVLTVRDELGRDAKVRLVGALPMRLTVFQGAILIADTAFTRLYPSEAGFRAFLLDAPAGQDGVAARLERTFERQGLVVVPAVQRLREFYGVETAYLSVFLLLGGLGLLLGAGGTGVVVLRNLFERRAEFALLSAVGYDPRTLTSVVLVEQLTLTLGGTITGILAALAALIPTAMANQTTASPAAILSVQIAVIAMNAALALLLVRLGLRGVSPENLRQE